MADGGSPSGGRPAADTQIVLQNRIQVRARHVDGRLVFVKAGPIDKHTEHERRMADIVQRTPELRGLVVQTMWSGQIAGASVIVSEYVKRDHRYGRRSAELAYYVYTVARVGSVRCGGWRRTAG